MIEDFPRAEVDWVGREDVAFCAADVAFCAADVAFRAADVAFCAADDLALLGGGRVVC